MGRRSRKSGVGVSTEVYLNDGVEEIADYDGSNNLLRRYVHGLGVDERLVMYTGTSLSSKEYYHTDHQGSSVAMSSNSGVLTDQYTYSVFGEPGAEGLTGNPFRYTGRRLDAETGLYYYRARFYSPSIGRFLQTDPIGYGDNMNMYAYVGNDPGNATDPTGRNACYINRCHFNINLPKVTGKQLGSLAADFTPILGDIKGFVDAYQDPSAVNIIAAVIGLAGPIGDGLGKALKGASNVADAARSVTKRLPDNAIVCRGGSCTADRFAGGSGVTVDAGGKLNGVSVNSAAGKSLNELTVGIPHNKVGVTTVGDVRKVGGDVIPSPNAGNPNHATLQGVTPQQAQDLMTPTVRNTNAR